MSTLPRLDQFGAQAPFVNNSIDDLTPQDFMDYEFMASNYIHSAEGLNLSMLIHSLSIGFKDLLVRDWHMSGIGGLCCLSLPSFIAEMRATFLPRGWDTGIRDSILSSEQADGEAVALWVSRLHAENALLRDTPTIFSNKDLLSHFKQNLNSFYRLRLRHAGDRGDPPSNVQKAIASRPPSADRIRVMDTSGHKRSRSRDSVPRRVSRFSRVSSCSPSRAHRRRHRRSSECNNDGHWEPSSFSSPRYSRRRRTCSISLSRHVDVYGSKAGEIAIPLSIGIPIINHLGLLTLTVGQSQFITRRSVCYKHRRIKVKYLLDDCRFGYPSEDEYRGITLAIGVTLASKVKHLSATIMQEGS
ncbi:hypothetical protein IW261DRAFT_1596612 [Armillaria novae-zelandiae]|uniref:Uncharacterized protein n=1 Tax=Armillaria novae-zelandiae TaxID=153914 RepID=A0AA39U2J3_9AGAR|nr:hypothetical protein IW261DRAFT_1596612 [Armillaria novae-zelandiae]